MDQMAFVSLKWCFMVFYIWLFYGQAIHQIGHKAYTVHTLPFPGRIRSTSFSGHGEQQQLKENTIKIVI